METSPMPFRHAAAAWAVAAGAAGAFVPQEFADLAAMYSRHDDDEVPTEALSMLLKEAERRAEWRGQYHGTNYFKNPDLARRTYIAPRTGEIVGDRLEWVTSVTTVLCPHPDGGWVVRIEGHSWREERLTAWCRDHGYRTLPEDDEVAA